MPVISMFYGIVVIMYYYETKQNNLPHIHVEYAGETAVIAIPNGNLLEGSLPSNKLKLVLAWIEIHQEDLMQNWKLAANGEKPFRLDPLK